eukprot:TRINITY_DN10915_c0_g2_i3.p1 TRINITY_DN10915_c0_g2~~TRINITY_DN10915_c0_g2_i3.p1  ORF type:complete len:517 (+),score=99.12 TRINITY_DN10915_c0_g2_i3:44-1552(+)
MSDSNPPVGDAGDAKKRKASPLPDEEGHSGQRKPKYENGSVAGQDDTQPPEESDGEDYFNANNDSDDDDSGDDDDDDGPASSEEDNEALSKFQETLIEWIKTQRADGRRPMKVLSDRGIDQYSLWKYMVTKDEDEMTDDEKWALVHEVLTHPRNLRLLFREEVRRLQQQDYRKRIPGLDSLDDVAEAIKKANNIVILTGAGVSVSCGIPDFRSPNGLYAQIEDKYDLPDPQCLFDIEFLKIEPRPFFEFAKEIYPGSYTPSPTHFFIKELQKQNKLLRNYTQNIDTLEAVAGIDPVNVVTCHGSFATATCITCRRQVSSDYIKEDIMKQDIPYCEKCKDEESFYKPDIVFFGEPLPDRFGDCLKEDNGRVDLLLVMGSSLSVKPVAYIPKIISPTIPQILVNREIVARPHEFDYAYLGFADDFVHEICSRLGWTLPPSKPVVRTDSIAAPSSAGEPPATTSTTTTTWKARPKRGTMRRTRRQVMMRKMKMKKMMGGKRVYYY